MTPLAALDKVDEIVTSAAQALGHDEELFELCQRAEVPLDCLAKLNWFLEAPR
jgi:hypothetical protein